MKKMILAAILATVSAVSMAEGTNGHFTGFGVGAELGATDWSDGGRTVADVNAVGSYGFAFPGTELVGQADVKYNFGNGRVYSDDGESVFRRPFRFQPRTRRGRGCRRENGGGFQCGIGRGIPTRAFVQQRF